MKHFQQKPTPTYPRCVPDSVRLTEHMLLLSRRYNNYMVHAWDSWLPCAQSSNRDPRQMILVAAAFFVFDETDTCVSSDIKYICESMAWLKENDPGDLNITSRFGLFKHTE